MSVMVDVVSEDMRPAESRFDQKDVSEHSGILHYRDFTQLSRLCDLKRSKGVTISVGIPTLNEAQTIGEIVGSIKGELVDRYPLIDEVVVVDSGSEDNTVELALKAGARAFKAESFLPEFSATRGKGENLWKSLYLLSGEIIVWLDADIRNFDPRFVTGLVGPLLENDDISYSTAYYRRPLLLSNELLSFNGGRVTELLVRPFLSYILPEICEFYQPMAGEHAGRRSLLETLPFFSGYAVDVGLLIDITHRYGKKVIAQVDLGERIHRHHEIMDLNRQAFGVLQALTKRAQDWGRLDIREHWNVLQALHQEGDTACFRPRQIVETERPPMNSLAPYCNKFPRVSR
jgi:glucosyl-3-phosphoglycerate synthase